MKVMAMLLAMQLFAVGARGHGGGDHADDHADDHDNDLMQAEVPKMHAVVRQFHEAITKKNADALRQAMGVSLYRVHAHNNARAMQWSPGYVIPSDKYVSNFKSLFMEEDFLYENTIDFLNTEVGYEGGLVTTHERGRYYRGSDWDAVNVWQVQRVGEEWKVLGVIFDAPNVSVRPGVAPLLERSVVVNAFIDGSDTFIIRPDGVQILHHNDIKPGRWSEDGLGNPGSVGREPTYVNGFPWYPAWHHNESRILPFNGELVLPLDAEYTLSHRGRSQSRLVSPTEEHPYISVRVDDPANGAAWCLIKIQW